VGPRTADRHRENLMRKLGARSLADLVRIAVRVGLSRD
jgi:FixJ family two-component response regulator